MVKDMECLKLVRRPSALEANLKLKNSSDFNCSKPEAVSAVSLWKVDEITVIMPLITLNLVFRCVACGSSDWSRQLVFELYRSSLQQRRQCSIQPNATRIVSYRVVECVWTTSTQLMCVGVRALFEGDTTIPNSKSRSHSLKTPTFFPLDYVIIPWIRFDRIDRMKWCRKRI